MKRKSYEEKSLKYPMLEIVRGNAGSTSTGTGFDFSNGLAGTTGPSATGNDPSALVYANQQRMMENMYHMMQQQSDQTQKTYMLNKMREEMEMFQQFVSLDLQMRTLPYKVSRSFGQALGQVVIT